MIIQRLTVDVVSTRRTNNISSTKESGEEKKTQSEISKRSE